MARRLDELLPSADQARVVAAISAAEARTSGQIKVHIDLRCAGDPLARARRLFTELGLTKTTHHNAVLIYVAPSDRKFALVGDSGIHGRGGVPLWARAAAAMREAFVRGALGEGLVAAIGEVGEALGREFPRQGSDGNEIPDAISSGPGTPGTQLDQ